MDGEVVGWENSAERSVSADNHKLRHLKIVLSSPPHHLSSWCYCMPKISFVYLPSSSEITQLLPRDGCPSNGTRRRGGEVGEELYTTCADKTVFINCYKVWRSRSLSLCLFFDCSEKGDWMESHVQLKDSSGCLLWFITVINPSRLLSLSFPHR